MRSNKVLQINAAECIIEAFWDREINGLKYWNIKDTVVKDDSDEKGDWWEHLAESMYSNTNGLTITTNTDYGLFMNQIWCDVNFGWVRKPLSGSALSMNRDVNVDCGSYDNLIFAAVIPQAALLTIKAVTDKGEIEKTFPSSKGIKKEYSIYLDGARQISNISIIVDAVEDGSCVGKMCWIGLQNTSTLEKYLEKWKGYDESWIPYLKPVEYEPEFKPEYGFIFDSENIREAVTMHDSIIKESGKSPYEEKVKIACLKNPEEMISEFIQLKNDTRFARERDYGNDLLENGVNAAVYAYLTHDKTMLRLAARYALSIAFCDHFDDGFICDTAGSNFEHKAFVQGNCARDLALILDMAWDYFTVVGREYIMRRLAEESIGKLNARILKYSEKPEEIFKMNQLLLFSEGRILGNLVLEKYFKRAKKYTDIAYNELIESIEQSVLEDGGYAEGGGYFFAIGKQALQCVYYYTKLRGLDFYNSVPNVIKKTAAFGHALVSTDDDLSMIAICDSKEKNFNMEYFTRIAAFVPKSMWVNMFWKKYKQNNNVPDNLTSILMLKFIGKGIEFDSLVELPDMGIVASHRKLNGEMIKLLVLGNRANSGHNHEDKGSFVLEYAGSTFAMDSGICDYGNEFVNILGNCQRHNMLVPYGIAGQRPHPKCPLPYNVKPRSKGDEKTFYSKLELAAGWEGFYTLWNRNFSSSSPEELTICDEYELENGAGVDFLWNTMLDAEIKNNTVKMTGKRGSVVIIAPEDTKIFVEKLPLPDGAQNRITIRKEGIKGKLETKVRFC